MECAMTHRKATGPDSRRWKNRGRRIRGSITRSQGQWKIVFPYLIGYSGTARATEYYTGTWHEAFIRYAAHDLIIVEAQYDVKWHRAALFLTP